MKTLALALLAVTAPAWAQAPAAAPVSPPTYALSWVRAEGAEDCPAAHALASEVERRLGRPVFDARAERSIEVDVMRFGDRHRSDVYVRDAAGRALGHRQLESDEPGCGALLSATALAVALVIDPEAASREPPTGNASFEPAIAPPPPRAPEPALAPAPVAPPPRPPRSEALLARPTPSGVAVALRGQLDFGSVPALSPGAALAVVAHRGERWGLELSAGYVHSQQVRRGIGSLDIGLTRGSALLLYSVGHSQRVSFDLGLGPTLGAYHVAPLTPPPITGSGDFWFAAIQGELRLQLAVTKAFLLETGGSLLAAPARQEFAVRGQDAFVWRQPALAGSLFLGVGALFP